MWLCIAEGFPGLPFAVDRDLTREDGIIQCTRVSELELVRWGWRAVRAVRILLDFLAL